MARGLLSRLLSIMLGEILIHANDGHSLSHDTGTTGGINLDAEY